MKPIDDFVVDFRRAGLVWAQYACLSVAVLLLMFILFPALSNQYTGLASSLRVVMLVLILGLIWVLYRHNEFSVRYYVVLVGGVCISILFGLFLLVAIDSFNSVARGFSPLPLVLVALFINYGFLRLPVAFVTGVSVVFSIVIVLAAPDEFSGAGQVRAFLYLLAMNLLGMLLCRSIESRERELFVQRRRAESAQSELKERARIAEEAHMEKTRLLAAVSHDLRQPMMATTAYLSVLKGRFQRKDFDQAEKQLGLISDSIGMLGATLDHLLTAARYDSGTEPINVESVEIEPLFERIRATFEDEASKKGIELRVRIPDQRIVVSTDAMALWRVLMNLVSNAIKFTEPTGLPGRGVVVRCTLLGSTCRIDVADNGIGVSEEFQRAIWQPYFQVANAERNRAHGLGLGLFLVRRAIDHLPEHRLAMRSRPDRGSRFSVFLPGSRLSQREVLKVEPPLVSQEDLDIMAGAYILIIEDDQDARRAMQALLDEWGVVYSSGATLEEVLLDAASSMRTVDAIVTDYRLPGTRTGIDCIVELRRHLEDNVPAVIVTGESDLSVIRKAMPAGTVLLQKPFDPVELAMPLKEAAIRGRNAEAL